MVDLIAADGLPERLDRLREPSFWPDQPERVEAIETHLSWVFLTRRYAFKLKKPVRHLDRDLRTVEARRESAETELRLNRRLAPTVYLGVTAVVRTPAGELALGDRGVPVDWLVWMRRLPPEHMLTGALQRGVVPASRLVPAARHLTEFYQTTPPRPQPPDPYVERLQGEVDRCRASLSSDTLGLPPATVARVREVLLGWLLRNREQVGARGARVVEGHGDLRPEHVYLGSPRGDGPAFIDCLEFDASLRLVDPVDELGFLAMSAERMGAAKVGEAFFRIYREATGDTPDLALIRFYQAVRALTWARLAVWRSEEPDQDREKWRGMAGAWLEEARSRAAALR